MQGNDSSFTVGRVCASRRPCSSIYINSLESPAIDWSSVLLRAPAIDLSSAPAAKPFPTLLPDLPVRTGLQRRARLSRPNRLIMPRPTHP